MLECPGQDDISQRQREVQALHGFQDARDALTFQIWNSRILSSRRLVKGRVARSQLWHWKIECLERTLTSEKSMSGQRKVQSKRTLASSDLAAASSVLPH